MGWGQYVNVRAISRMDAVYIRKEFVHALHVVCGDPLIYEDASRKIYSVLFYGATYEDVRRMHGLDPDAEKPNLRDYLGAGGLQAVALAEELSTRRLEDAGPLNFDEVLSLVETAASDALADIENQI
jgi:hypothetical protein